MNFKTYVPMLVIGTLSILKMFPVVVLPMIRLGPKAGFNLAILLIGTLFLFWFYSFKTKISKL